MSCNSPVLASLNPAQMARKTSGVSRRPRYCAGAKERQYAGGCALQMENTALGQPKGAPAILPSTNLVLVDDKRWQQDDAAVAHKVVVALRVHFSWTRRGVQEADYCQCTDMHDGAVQQTMPPGRER